MRLEAEIAVKEDISDIERLFSSEEKTFANKRAQYGLRKEKGRLVFLVHAEDSSALRAVVTSITKLLSVYEKTKSIAKGA